MSLEKWHIPVDQVYEHLPACSDFTELQAAMILIAEMHRGEQGGTKESSPEDVAKFLYDATGKPLPPSPQAVAEAAAKQKDRSQMARHATGLVPEDGDYVVDVLGNRLTPEQVSGMTDSKGRPLVIPRY